GRLKAMTGNEPSNHAVIVGAFTADDAQLVAQDGHAPGLSGHLGLFRYRPMNRVDRVEPIRLDRAHPEFFTVKSERLWARRRRRQPQRLRYILHVRSLYRKRSEACAGRPRGFLRS